MSLIVHSKLDELYQHICSKKFISKIFLLENKNNIQKMDNGKKILFNRIYNYKDLHNIETISVPDNVTSLIETNMQNIQIIMEKRKEYLKSIYPEKKSKQKVNNNIVDDIKFEELKNDKENNELDSKSILDELKEEFN